MPASCLEHTAFWDETHRKVRLGDATSDGTVVVAPWDEHGRPDPNGEVGEVEHSPGVKHPGEVRFSLGVHLGDRCPPFSCTECALLTIDDFETQVRLEVQRIKGPPDGRTAGWVSNGRAQGCIHGTDSPAALPQRGDEEADHLRGLGITTVADVRDADSIAPWEGVPATTISLWKTAAEAAFADVPEAVDHRRADDPCLARHGEADWRAKVAASTALKKSKCVTEMVDHSFFWTCSLKKNNVHHDVASWENPRGAMATAHRHPNWRVAPFRGDALDVA